jgi:hypothetical protein
LQSLLQGLGAVFIDFLLRCEHGKDPVSECTN